MKKPIIQVVKDFLSRRNAKNDVIFRVRFTDKILLIERTGLKKK